MTKMKEKIQIHLKYNFKPYFLQNEISANSYLYYKVEKWLMFKNSQTFKKSSIS